LIQGQFLVQQDGSCRPANSFSWEYRFVVGFTPTPIGDFTKGCQPEFINFSPTWPRHNRLFCDPKKQSSAEKLSLDSQSCHPNNVKSSSRERAEDCILRNGQELIACQQSIMKKNSKASTGGHIAGSVNGWLTSQLLVNRIRQTASTGLKINRKNLA
jgi:hypothetical protein